MSTIQTQRTSVEALRRELHLRFEDEEFENPQGASELLSELVIDPTEKSAVPLFFHELLSCEKRTAFAAGHRVPSPKEGDALPLTLPFPSFHPHTILQPVINWSI